MKLKDYAKKIFKTRYFWIHLVRCDLKSRFRRSKLGMLWMLIQPLLLTMIMSTVFSTVFKQPLGEYAVYILSGIIVWDMVSSCTVAGGNSLMSAEQYIRQFNHPVTIYSLKSALLYIIMFLIEMIALVLWTLVTQPENLIFGFITLPLTTLLYFLLAWSVTTIAGFVNTKYRDYPQMMGLAMQTIWYLSPVFFKEEMFSLNPALNTLFNLNPITHILNLIRYPFLYGKMAGTVSYLFTVGTIILFAVWAYFINKNNSKKIIFYL